MSHPMWVRGLKHQEPTERVDAVWVAPYVGAWIETSLPECRHIHAQSHPMWVRGLKLKR